VVPLLSPAELSAIAAVSTAVGYGIKLALDRRKAEAHSNGHVSSESTLRLRSIDDERVKRLEHEVLDSTGTMRTRFHDQAQRISEAVLRSELNTRRLDRVEETGKSILDRLDALSSDVARVREDVAFLRGRGQDGAPDVRPGGRRGDAP